MENKLASPIVLATLLTGLYFGLSIASNAADVSIQVIDDAGKPVENAVIYAEPHNKSLIPDPPTTVTNISQEGKQFHPLVSVVQTGSSITFPNLDNVRHHVYSFSPAKVFELKLYKGIPTNPVIFDTAGTVVLGCNIHDNMMAFVEVVDTPYFTKTDLNGKAVLTNLSGGQYQLKTWHYALVKENVVNEQTITVKGNDNLVIKLSLKPFDVPIPR